MDIYLIAARTRIHSTSKRDRASSFAFGSFASPLRQILQEGLAQGYIELTPYPLIAYDAHLPPPYANFFIEGAAGAPIPGHFCLRYQRYESSEKIASAVQTRT